MAEAERASVADAGAAAEADGALVDLVGLAVRSPSTFCSDVEAGADEPPGDDTPFTACGDSVPPLGRVVVDVVGVPVVWLHPPGVVHSLPLWQPPGVVHSLGLQPPGVVQPLPCSQPFGLEHGLQPPGVVQSFGGGVTVACVQPVCAGFVRPMPWLRSHS